MASQAGLQQYMADFRHFSTALAVVAEIAPDRMTLSQTTFFLFAAMSDLTGRPATFTEIKEAVGPAIGKSLHTTYKALLNEGRNRDGKRDTGIGWLKRETDPTDNRRKYLRLTPKGRKAMNEIGVALNIETRGH